MNDDTATRSAAPPAVAGDDAPRFNLLDGASPAEQTRLDELGDRRSLAADPTRPLAERLEAYEDIVDSEVGDTQLARARNIEREHSLRQIYLKFEGGNPTGTQKDRIAFAQTQDAMRRGFDAITVATCGNFGAALALAASVAGLRCVCFIPAGYHTRRIDEIARAGAEIRRVPGDYETTVEVSRETAERDEIYDANPGGANTAIQLQAYGGIAFEIYDELRDAPAAVAVSVSNGTTLAGIHRGFLSLYRRGKTSRIPRMVAGSSAAKNPIVRSFRRNLPQCEDLDPAKVRETVVNEPLINWHSSDGDLALAAIRSSKGWADDASDKEMLAFSRLLKNREGLSVLPASTAGLAVLLRHRVDPLPGDRYVAVLTREALMPELPEGNAVVYCQGAFNTPNGKTAHGLVRRTARYRVLSVLDSAWAGRDAGDVLDRRPAGIPLLADLPTALEQARQRGLPATHFVVGLAPDGGRLGPAGRDAVKEAIRAGLAVDCGLHDFLTEDPELTALAAEHGVTVRDVRKPPHRDDLHFFSGKIEEVDCLKIALLGTDSAVGKRTTAWVLVEALAAAGHPAQMVGTGQTAWMQGARFAMVMDSIVSDFVAGEIEHAVWSAWKEASPAAIVIEGQGSLMNPAYPGGFEILAAGRPDVVIMQHAPTRVEYDGFPGYPLHPLPKQIEAVELISGKPVVAITVNHEGLEPEEVPAACRAIEEETGLPAVDVLLDGAGRLVEVLEPRL